MHEILIPLKIKVHTIYLRRFQFYFQPRIVVLVRPESYTNITNPTNLSTYRREDFGEKIADRTTTVNALALTSIETGGTNGEVCRSSSIVYRI